MPNKAYLLATVCSALFAAPLAHAETVDSDPAVGELTVTTQRRVQNSIDVPVALSAYSGETLNALGVEDLHELSAFTPGLLVQNKSATDSRFIMRGIGSDDGSSYQEPRVSVFLDGAPIAKSRGSFVELFDIERIEVARGPQTTLFGQGALIGAINIVQNKADPSAFDWRLSGEVGSYDSRTATAMINVPVGDSFAIRAAGQYRTRDGNVANVLGGEDFGGFEIGAARLAFAWRPSDTLSTDLMVNHQHDEGSGQPYKSLTFLPADPVTGAVRGGLDPYSGAALAAGQGFEGGRTLGLERDVTGASTTTALKLSDALALTSTTAWRRFEGFQAFDHDGFAFPLLTVGDETIGEQFSQEFRANFKPSSTFDIVAGVNFSKEQGHQRTPLQVDERLVLSLLTGDLDRTNPTLDPLASYADPVVQGGLLQGLASARGFALSTAQAQAIARNLRGNHVETYTDTAQNKAYDVYADVSWTATERLSILAGARYAYSEKETGLSASLPTGRSVLAGFMAALGRTGATRTALINALAAPGAVTSAGPVPMVGLRVQPTTNNGDAETQSLSDDGPAFRLAAHYKVSDDLGTYVSYARGRRPQVLSPTVPDRPFGPVAFENVAAETVDSYEVGLKFRSPSRKVSINSALYFYEYAHFQTVVQQGAQYVTADAGRAASVGLETDASWNVTDNARLFANYTWSRARFREGLYNGNHLALSPDHAGTLGLDAQWPAFEGVVRLLPTYRYVSKVFFTDDNSVPALITGALVTPIGFEGSQEGYGVADLRIDYSPKAGRWSAGVFVNNAFDKRYVKESGNGGEDFGLPTYIAGDPRIVGISLQIRR